MEKASEETLHKIRTMVNEAGKLLFMACPLGDWGQASYYLSDLHNLIDKLQAELKDREIEAAIARKEAHNG